MGGEEGDFLTNHGTRLSGQLHAPATLPQSVPGAQRKRALASPTAGLDVLENIYIYIYICVCVCVCVCVYFWGDGGGMPGAAARFLNAARLDRHAMSRITLGTTTAALLVVWSRLEGTYWRCGVQPPAYNSY